MFNLVIFGAPGSGKGTQSEKLIDRYGLTHISTGDVLRKEIAAGSELGKIADSYISKGQLIPDDLMVDILAKEVDRLRPQSKGFIFDGFPRTIPQAEALENAGVKFDCVLDIEVPDSEIMNRMTGRRACTACGATYHVVAAPPKSEGVCDACGAALVQRDDDKPETVQSRLDVYHSQTEPLKEFYAQRGVLKSVAFQSGIEATTKAIVDALGI